MRSQFSEPKIQQAVLTLRNIESSIKMLIEWNSVVDTTGYYYRSQNGIQLLAANCTLITAIGEGINRVNRLLPDFLETNFPSVPWHAIVGMRNHIAHGYFELDAEIIHEAVKVDIPPLLSTIQTAIDILHLSI